MKKTHLLLIILTLIMLGVTYTVFSLNKTFLLLWNANTICVETQNPLQKEKVKIMYGNPGASINRKSDKELFYDGNFKTTFYKGKKVEDLPNKYGENDFLIIYADSLYCSFRHYKLNRRKQHDYHFNFKTKNNIMYVTVAINGAFKLNFTKEMIPVKDAHMYYANKKVVINNE